MTAYLTADMGRFRGAVARLTTGVPSMELSDRLADLYTPNLADTMSVADTLAWSAANAAFGRDRATEGRDRATEGRDRATEGRDRATEARDAARAGAQGVTLASDGVAALTVKVDALTVKVAALAGPGGGVTDTAALAELVAALVDQKLAARLAA